MAKKHKKTPEEKAAVAKQKKQQRRARRKQETRDNLAKEEIFEYVQKQYGTMPEYLRSKLPDSAVPVSYTHLDVYKRQA